MSKGGHGALCAFDKVARRKPLVVAADAALMQIQLYKRARSSRGQTLRRSMAVDSVRRGVGQGRKMSLTEKLREREQEFGSVTRDSGRKPTEMGERFELEKEVSCGSGDHRWRTKLDLGCGKSFDDHHRSTALGTAPEIVRARGVLIGLRLLCHSEQLKAKR